MADELPSFRDMDAILTARYAATRDKMQKAARAVLQQFFQRVQDGAINFCLEWDGAVYAEVAMTEFGAYVLGVADPLLLGETLRLLLHLGYPVRNLTMVTYADKFVRHPHKLHVALVRRSLWREGADAEASCGVIDPPLLPSTADPLPTDHAPTS